MTNKILTSQTILILIIISVWGMVMVNCKSDTSRARWKKIITLQLNRYPEMEFVDLYKFIYQGTLGPAHLGTTYDQIRKYLNQEYAKIEGYDQVMIEKIAGDNKYVRIDLHAFKAQGGNPDSLAKLVFRSCQKEANAIPKLQKRLHIAGDLLKTGPWKLDYSAYQKYLATIKSEDYPVPHHSKKYISHYNPAYRVISFKIYQQDFASCFPQK